MKINFYVFSEDILKTLFLIISFSEKLSKMNFKNNPIIQFLSNKQNYF